MIMNPFPPIPPEIIAEFWVYLFIAFIFGVIIGFLCCRILSKRSIDVFNIEKEAFLRKKIEHEKLKLEHETLKNEIKKSKEYWTYVQQNEIGTDKEINFYQKAADKINNKEST